jgi:signal transduction histidine kinase
VTDESLLVPVLALLSSGVASVALAPRNNASRVLLVGAVAATASFLLTPLAVGHSPTSVWASLVRYLVTASFLVFSAMIALLELAFPDGHFERGWHRRLGAGFVVLAIVGPVMALFGSPELTADGDESTRIHNVLALPGLATLGQLGDAVQSTEPVWFVIGFVVLVLRFRGADPGRRKELWPLLGGLLVLMLFLVPVVVEVFGGPDLPEPAFELAFRAAVALLPIALLAGISRQTRMLARDLAASRDRIISAEDQARHLIERDLHDGVQQQLVALLSLNELAARQARSASVDLPGTLADVRVQLMGAIEELRELVNGIRPPVLADSGVAAALESRMRRLPAQVSLDLAGAGGSRWPAPTEAAAYFVACEAITNALKHAPGAPVQVRLTDLEGELVLEVEDEGPGLPRERYERGLLGLRDRVDSIGGTLIIGAGAGGGALLRATFAGRLPEEAHA